MWGHEFDPTSVCAWVFSKKRKILALDQNPLHPNGGH